MQKSDSIENLAKALSAAQSKFGQIRRTEKVDFMGAAGRRKYNYAPLDEIIAACRNALAENGLAILQLTSQETVEYLTLETVLAHSSGEWISGTMRVAASLAEPQKQGSALTYARRYALSALLNVASEEDDDGDEAGKAPPKEAAKPPVRSPAPVQTEKPTVTPYGASDGVSQAEIITLADRTVLNLTDLKAQLNEAQWRPQDFVIYLERTFGVKGVKFLTGEQLKQVLQVIEQRKIAGA